MIVKKSGLLVLALVVQAASVFAAATRGVRPSTGSSASTDRVSVSQADARKLLASMEVMLNEIREANKAPRPSAAQPCDPNYPSCNTIDLTEITQCLCLIKKDIDCLLEKTCSSLDIVEDTELKVCSMLDILGDCTDISILLPSVVDKQDVDDLCETVITLLKTILLELRGSFQGL